jgi:hypothetical protein
LDSQSVNHEVVVRFWRNEAPGANTMSEKNTRSKPLSPSKRRFLKEKQLATRWIMSVRTLQKHRLTGSGCQFHHFEGSVRYRLRDIKEYERNSRRKSTSDPGFSA